MGSRLREPCYLFELYCEVSPGDHMLEPHIIKKYPETYKNEEELKSLPKFTFPCPLDRNFVQQYSYVLTSVDSKYTFCFCRYDPKANKALVIVSYLPWHDVFYKLLNSIATIVNGPNRDHLKPFLDACRFRPPAQGHGHTLKVSYNIGDGIFSCECPDNKLPSIPENCNLTEYFSAMDSHCMAGLWAALLHERRIAIVATKPSRLSACVQAANATLFPMSWQHIFIPILPKHLVDYLFAPMPFLIGVPRAVMSTVSLTEIGDVVVLDVDANELRSPFNDLETLPTDMVSTLQKALSDKNALGDAVSRAFLRALVTLIGGYRDAIRIEKGQLITFNPEAFIKTRKNMQPFLKKILQSQIFQQFIDERLELLNSGKGFNDEFEVECNNYADKLNSASGQKLRQQYKEWVKNVKREGGAFFKTVRDKANPAVQSAVKTVRQGGKNVKSAVKGLKNKMPKPGSRPSSLNTMDESRFSCGSATPVSSDSSESSPAHDYQIHISAREHARERTTPVHYSQDSEVPRPPSRPPREPTPEFQGIDLLTEMEHIFGNNQRRDSFPNSTHSPDIKLVDKAKTLSPRPPPRLPERPHPPLRYPIVSTRKLVDLSDAPAPPPRSSAPNNQFISNITIKDTKADFQTSTIRFTEGNDKEKLKLTLSNPKKPPAQNGSKPKLISPMRPQEPPPRPVPASNKGRTQEPSGSEVDLIKLDDSPTVLEDFDPLKHNKTKQEPTKSTDSALLHEYGLDFSQFGLFDFKPSTSSQDEHDPSVPKGWTTFN